MTTKVMIGLCMSICMAAVTYAEDGCHPDISSAQQNFMIGYGSLMQAESRQRTNPEVIDVYPIEMSGYERRWGLNGGKYKTTFLTIIRESGSNLNAVYYPVEEGDIKASDQRELAYCRVQVSKNDLSPLGLRSLPEGVYWVYVNENPHLQSPSHKYPIAQSYVDIFLDGCMQVGQTYKIDDFMEKCVIETSDWPRASDGKWINDRVFPRRPVGKPNVPSILEIDKLLSEHFEYYYDIPYGP